MLTVILIWTFGMICFGIWLLRETWDDDYHWWECVKDNWHGGKKWIAILEVEMAILLLTLWPVFLVNWLMEEIAEKRKDKKQ